MHLTRGGKADRDAFVSGNRLTLGRCSMTQGEFEEINGFLVLQNVALLQILEHVPVALDQNLRVLLPVAELFVAVSLDALQKVRHESRLLLYQLLLHLLVLLVIVLDGSEFLKLLKLVS